MQLNNPTLGAQSAPLTVSCIDLETALDYYTSKLGFRLEMIMPADAPRIALVSGHGVALRLEAVAANNARLVPTGTQADAHTFAVVRGDGQPWAAGRAGMQYRDLLPDRLGGAVIASHIRIAEGGPVPDYVHYHKIGFQLIYCLRGWVRVVYEGQGPPFVMHAGDCVLQPPTIRHRVLESSPGLEVIEIGCPAEHETWRDHDLVLPSPTLYADREFQGQRFQRHIASQAQWQPSRHEDFEFRDTGMGMASNGLADVRVLRGRTRAGERNGLPEDPLAQRIALMVLLEGNLQLHRAGVGPHVLTAGDTCVVPAGIDYALTANGACELLEIMLPHSWSG